MNKLHDMTKKEYLAEGARRLGQKCTRKQNIFLTAQHRSKIFNAIKAGYCITDEVLKAYPDMAAFQINKYFEAG